MFILKTTSSIVAQWVALNLKNFLLSLVLIVLSLVINFNASAQISYENYTSEHKTELERLDGHIDALRTKRDWMINNPDENDPADVEIWLSNARTTMWQLFAEKRKIIRIETNKEFFSIEEFAELSVEKQQIVIDENKSIIEQ